MSLPGRACQTAKEVTTVATAPTSETEGEENRLQTVFGLQMNKPSADSFKVMVAVASMIVLAAIGLAAFAFTRKPASNGSRPPQRTKTNANAPPPEG